MKVLIFLILLFIGIICQAQKKPTTKNHDEKYLMPLNDTMDVVEIKKQNIELFTGNYGEYSAIVPVLIDEDKPNGDYFLPHRCLYDTDLANIFAQLNLKSKCWLIISEKKIKIK